MSMRSACRPQSAPAGAVTAFVVALAGMTVACHAGPGIEPAPDLPDLSSLQQAPAPTFAPADRLRRLTEKGMTAGSRVMIRIFKAESELELWLQKDDRFELFAIYPICFWSGRLGPKQREGDRQAPEGFYTVATRQLHRRGRHPRSLDLGFPNALDRAYARTGSYILVHGGCQSIGCYAMTNPVMEEIYALSEQALLRGQERVQVHVFPFRMTEDNMKVFSDHQWHEFWQSLKSGYDMFERTRVPPRIGVCDKKYVVSEGDPPGDPAAPVPNPWSALPACERDELEAALWQSPETSTATRYAHKGHRMVYRSHIRRFAKRNARRAYATARRARVVSYAKRMRTTYVGGAKRAH
jgi:murein L,D-transpeptidase YafK